MSYDFIIHDICQYVLLAIRCVKSMLGWLMYSYPYLLVILHQKRKQINASVNSCWPGVVFSQLVLNNGLSGDIPWPRNWERYHEYCKYLSPSDRAEICFDCYLTLPRYVLIATWRCLGIDLYREIARLQIRCHVLSYLVHLPFKSVVRKQVAWCTTQSALSDGYMITMWTNECKTTSSNHWIRLIISDTHEKLTWIFPIHDSTPTKKTQHRCLFCCPINFSDTKWMILKPVNARTFSRHSCAARHIPSLTDTT